MSRDLEVIIGTNRTKERLLLIKGMSYLRLSSIDLPLEQKREIARQLTNKVSELLPDEKKERCTVHFQAFRPEDCAIGGQLIIDGRAPHFHLEFSFPVLPKMKKRELVNELTPLLGRLLGLRPNELHRVSVIFSDYDPQDFAVGGKFLSEMGSTATSKAS
jgi:phenylpyruvate tautomerase PptA (4-oxalocrotonate tautomerase family)